MFKFITHTNHSNTVNVGSTQSIRDHMQGPLHEVMDYYHMATKATRSSVFSKLIDRLTVSNTLSDVEYLSRIKQDAKFATNISDFTSYNNKGKTIYTELFNAKHIIITVSNSDIFDIITRDWKTMSPIKPSGLTNTDISLAHPVNSEVAMDVLVLNIDIVAMMFQYKKWVTYRRSLGLSTTTSLYVQQYLLTNTIPLFFDLAIFTSFLLDRDVIVKKVHPFSLRSYKQEITKLIEKAMYKANKRIAKYDEYLSFIPTIYHDNIFYLIKDRVSLKTRNNYWASTVIYIPILYRLLKMSNKRTLDNNNRTLSEINIFMRTYRTNNSYRLPKIGQYNMYFNYIINEIERMAE